PDLLMDGKEAILVKPKSPDSLADGVRRLLEDEKLRRRVIHGGQEAARKVTLERGAIEIVRELQRWLTGEERGHPVSA
ncbi:MAG: glycosyltransferase, partial [Candidatus Micrarchaeota archaeon]